MSTPKHTPGTPAPWVVKTAVEYIAVWAPEDQEGGTLIAKLPETHSDAMENAALIAAAPALLAALQEIAGRAPDTEPEYQDWGGDTEDAENWGIATGEWECAEIARAAIRKAEGGGVMQDFGTVLIHTHAAHPRRESALLAAAKRVLLDHAPIDWHKLPAWRDLGRAICEADPDWYARLQVDASLSPEAGVTLAELDLAAEAEGLAR